MNRNNENSKAEAEANLKEAAGSGIVFCDLLAIAFIVLKLTGVIGWSWGWVLSPLWIPLAIVAGICIDALIVVLVKMVADEVKKSK